jgi:hypothetical protein
MTLRAKSEAASLGLVLVMTACGGLLGIDDPTLVTGVAGNGTGGIGPTSGGRDGAAGLGAAGAGGLLSVGGSSAGGAGTGGISSGTGGIAPQAGAGGGAALMNRFRAGPCAHSPDYTNVEVFARGEDQRIYRKVIPASTSGAWVALTDLDGSMLDNRSDLDCSGGETVYLAAMGDNPTGAFLRATGSGTTYNQFQRVLEGQTFIQSPSVCGTLVAATDSSGLATLENTINNPSTNFAPTLVNRLVSGPDLGSSSSPISTTIHLVAFDASGQLAYYSETGTPTGTFWAAPLLIAPPTDRRYAYSPTVCFTLGTHVVAVAGDRPWHAVNTGSGFTDWEQMADIVVTSSPDCAGTSDGTIHVVARSETGSILYLHGTTGNFAATDLGVY